jgi:hypothetical protein
MLKTLLIRPGLIATFYTHSDNQMQFHNSTFLPHGRHLASRVSQPESSKEPKSESHARDKHQTTHGNAWPAEQIMALSTASSGMVSP